MTAEEMAKALVTVARDGHPLDEEVYNVRVGGLVVSSKVKAVAEEVAGRYRLGLADTLRPLLAAALAPAALPPLSADDRETLKRLKQDNYVLPSQGRVAAAAALAHIEALERENALLLRHLHDTEVESMPGRRAGALEERRAVLALLESLRPLSITHAQSSGAMQAIDAAAAAVRARGEPPEPLPSDRLRADNDRLRECLGDVAAYLGEADVSRLAEMFHEADNVATALAEAEALLNDKP